LCSHLASIRVSDKVWPVLIEEIWREGAILECEEEIPQIEFAELDCGGPFFGDKLIFEGRLSRASEHEFGWRTEMTFSAGTLWSEKKFRPSHLLDPRKVKGPAKKQL